MEEERKKKMMNLMPTSNLDELYGFLKEFKYDEDKVSILENLDYFKEVNEHLKKEKREEIKSYTDIFKLVRDGLDIEFNLDNYIEHNIRIIKKPYIIQVDGIQYQPEQFWDELDFRKQLINRALDMLCLIEDGTDEFS